MKKFLIVSLLISLTFGLLNAMEISPPIPQEFFAGEPDLRINATMNKKEIGNICYGIKNGKMEIKDFFVEREYRDKKELKVGFNLFKSCIIDLKKNNCSQVRWDIIPTKNPVTHSELLAIYRKMLSRMEYQENKHYKIIPIFDEGNKRLSHLSIQLNLE